MPVIKHKTPCKQCPWRKGSINGYLGGSTPEEFYEQIEGEVHIPCHLHINDDDQVNASSMRQSAPYCAGSLIHLNNNCKLPRDPELVDAKRAVESDHSTVFAFKHQFVEHHSKTFKPKQ